MKKIGLLKAVKPFMVKHEPELLIALGVTGMILSTVWSVKATKTAVRRLDDIEKATGKKPDFKQTIKSTWKLYLPAALSMGVSIPAIIFSNRISNKRNMAVATALTISETALQEYQDKTREVVGEKKYEKIQEEVSKDLVAKTNNNITIIGEDEALFFEPLTSRYFKSNWNAISKAANELNAEALSNLSGVITLGDWFDILGLEATELGNQLGWSVIDGPNGLINISIDAVMDNKGRPCGAIRYNTRPKQI